MVDSDLLDLKPNKKGDSFFVKTNDAISGLSDINIMPKILSDYRNTINFYIYVPPLDKLPVYVKNKKENYNGIKLTPNDHIIVVNNVTESEKNTLFINEKELEKIMYTFAIQLKERLGLADAFNTLYKKSNKNISNQNKETFGLTEFETYCFYLHFINSNYNFIKKELSNTNHIINTIQNTIVTKEVSLLINQINDGLAKLKTSEIFDIKFINNLKYATKLASYLNSHPSLINREEFPPEHVYAIYLPLFFPLLLPIVMSLIKNLKELKKK